MKSEKRNAIYSETGKFLLDMAKLIFGGIILAGIMKLDINKLLLFSVGAAFVVLFFSAGILFITLSNPKD